MENEAASAGLRLKPRENGGRWKLEELREDHGHESLQGFWWWLMEHLPIKHLTYNDPHEATR
jgi:hypothetical protein